MSAKFTSHTACYVACVTDAEVRKSVASAAAERFTRDMRAILSERQLVAIDYVNTYRFFDMKGPTGDAVSSVSPCASHNFCDPNPLMLTAVSSGASSHMGPGDPEDHPLFDPDAELVEQIATREDDVGKGAAMVWEEAWEIAANSGFSVLWSHKDTVPAEATFQTLAELVMEHPKRAELDLYPECPVIPTDEAAYEAAVNAFVRYYIDEGEVIVEAATVLTGYVDDDDVDGVLDYFEGFLPPPAPAAPRP